MCIHIYFCVCLYMCIYTYITTIALCIWITFISIAKKGQIILHVMCFYTVNVFLHISDFLIDLWNNLIKTDLPFYL